MSNLDHLSPHELLERVESRNRLFKLASGVFGAVLVAGLTLLLVIGLSTLQAVDKQLASQKNLLDSQQKILSQIQSLGKQQTTQINDLQSHIDCIVALFQQPNRASLTITDLETCKLTPSSSLGGTTAVTKSTPIAQTAPVNNNSVPSKQPAANKATPPNTAVAGGRPSFLDKLPAVGGLFKALGL